jgi:hypothetical protein
MGKPGIKNIGIYEPLKSWLDEKTSWCLSIWLLFYLVLYFRPDYVVNWTFIFYQLVTFKWRRCQPMDLLVYTVQLC